jgi:uncharacterized SAM-binding protein YcdF (DUF218 family)
MSEVTAEIRSLAEILWDYHRLDPPLTASDVILVLGSHDHRIAEHAATIWLDGWAPLIVFSGGHGKITESWARSEASVFADIAERHGVPRTAMILEETASNTGENITHTRAVLDAAGIAVRSGILVSKPYMARRAVATAGKQWPDVQWHVSTPAGSLAEYTAQDSSERRSIELMVGDLQRIKIYAERGFQTPMSIPSRVWEAYERLVQFGFDRYVL